VFGGSFYITIDEHIHYWREIGALSHSDDSFGISYI
jgi:hypothetical protein